MIYDHVKLLFGSDFRIKIQKLAVLPAKLTLGALKASFYRTFIGGIRV